MKKLVFPVLVAFVMTLGACSENKQVAGLDIKLTDNELEAVNLAEEALSRMDFEQSIEKANEEIMKLPNMPEENFFEGASYEAYLLTRATLSKESYELARVQGIFASELTYDDYSSVSLSLVSQSEFKEMMDIDFDEEIIFDDLRADSDKLVDRVHFEGRIPNNDVEIDNYAYGAYIANSVKYLTPVGSRF